MLDPKIVQGILTHLIWTHTLQSRRSVSPQAVSLRAKRNAAEHAGGSVKVRGGDDVIRQSSKVHKQPFGERGQFQVRNVARDAPVAVLVHLCGCRGSMWFRE